MNINIGTNMTGKHWSRLENFCKDLNKNSDNRNGSYYICNKIIWINRVYSVVSNHMTHSDVDEVLSGIDMESYSTGSYHKIDTLRANTLYCLMIFFDKNKIDWDTRIESAIMELDFN